MVDVATDEAEPQALTAQFSVLRRPPLFEGDPGRHVARRRGEPSGQRGEAGGNRRGEA
jgi:hypothetical protein